jgi:hypothetical protein
MTRAEAFKQGRRIGAPLGGHAVKGKEPPARCPRCKQSMAGRSWHSYLGHLGLHGLADRHFGGDLQAAQRRLRENGLARQDPYPENGAWPVYQPLPVTRERHLDEIKRERGME